MFFGRFEHTIDEKGRVSVPARFREYLQGINDDRVVITNFFVAQARCLHLYPHSSWGELQERLRTQAQFDPDVTNFHLYYVGSAQPCELDKQGRILLPPPLREYAGLKRDVMFVSAVKKLQVWDKEEWIRVFGEAEQSLMKRPEVLKGLGI